MREALLADPAPHPPLKGGTLAGSASTGIARWIIAKGARTDLADRTIQDQIQDLTHGATREALR